MNAPKHKAESTSLFARGVYGNTIEQWETPAEALASTKQAFTIRYRGNPGVQGPAIFGVPRERLLADWKQLVVEGWEERRLYINEAIDAAKIRLQGELMLNWEDGWLFRGSEASGEHMRWAMAAPNTKTWRGWVARELLRSRMHPSSWDDLQCLLDWWPDAVIELVCMDGPVGKLAHTGRNVLFWECREF